MVSNVLLFSVCALRSDNEYLRCKMILFSCGIDFIFSVSLITNLPPFGLRPRFLGEVIPSRK